MPPVEGLKNPKDRFASIVYSADGEELGRYFNGTSNRVYVDFDDISQECNRCTYRYRGFEI